MGCDVRLRPRPRSALPRASLSRRAAVGPGGSLGEMPLCSRARSLPLRRKPLFPQGHRLPAGFGPALSGGVEPVPHPGLRQDCSAGKLTCAGAPPLCCLLFQPRGAEPPIAPLGRICLPPKARVLGLTLPCYGGFSQTPRNFSYPGPRREASAATAASLTLQVDGLQASLSSLTRSLQKNLCTALLPNPGAWALPLGPLLLGAREAMKSSGAVGGVVLCCKVPFATIIGIASV